MKQCDIWLADLNPVKGSEKEGIRPVVILSGNAMNDHMGIVIICPLSSKVKNYAGCLVLHPDPTNGINAVSEAIAFQISVLSKERLIKKMGAITEKQLSIIREGLNEILYY